MLTTAMKTLAAAVLDRLGPSLPLDAAADLQSLRIAVNANATVVRTFKLPAPLAVTSLRIESTNAEAFVTELKFGQVTLFSAPTAEGQGTDVAPATTTQLDTAQTRNGLRRPWNMPLTSTTCRVAVTNLSGQAQRVTVQVEGYSPPPLLDSLGELLTALR